MVCNFYNIVKLLFCYYYSTFCKLCDGRLHNSWGGMTAEVKSDFLGIISQLLLITSTLISPLSLCLMFLHWNVETSRLGTDDFSTTRPLLIHTISPPFEMPQIPDGATRSYTHHRSGWSGMCLYSLLMRFHMKKKSQRLHLFHLTGKTNQFWT